MRKYYACVKGHRDDLVSFYVGITTNLLQEVRKMKKRKKHLKPCIKHALQWTATVIICAIIALAMVFSLFMYHGTMTERYADPAYCEMRGN